MPGAYEGTQRQDPILATLLAPVLNGQGDYIHLNFDNFGQLVYTNSPGDQIAGRAADFQYEGFYTNYATSCVVVVAAQLNAQNQLESYYFAHLSGGSWVDENTRLFDQWIVDKAHTWMALYSESGTIDHIQSVFQNINAAVDGNIPQNQCLIYKGTWTDFGFRLADLQIGECPPGEVPPNAPILPPTPAPPGPPAPPPPGPQIAGVEAVTFTFPVGSTSTRTESIAMNNIPGDAYTSEIYVTGWDVSYPDDDHYDFGALGVSVLANSVQEVSATVTLRDDNVDKRSWSATVRALVFFFEDSD